MTSQPQSPHPKLKSPPRALFSCGIFRNCIQSAFSPSSTTNPPPSSSAIAASSSPPPDAKATSSPSPPSPLPSASPPAPSPHPPPAPGSSAVPGDFVTVRPLPSTSSSSSSSSSTSQSFTQWRFPLHHTHPHQPPPEIEHRNLANNSVIDLAEAFRAAELQFASGAHLPALRLLDRLLAADSSPQTAPCPPAVMAGVVEALREQATARPAAKVLLALLLPEQNRRAGVEAGAASAAVEAVAAAAASGPATGLATAERALAALELLCTVPEGATEVRGHPCVAAALARSAEGMAGRARECAIGVMAAIYGGSGEDAVSPPPEVARAVVAALQGECSARGRRKGARLLRALQENGRLDLEVASGRC